MADQQRDVIELLTHDHCEVNPHPSAADEPPDDTLLGPVARLFDRMRDAVTRRGTER